MRDLARTFPHHEFFQKESGQEALKEVVKAYSNFDPEVGYTQSIGFISGILLMNVRTLPSFLPFSVVCNFLPVVPRCHPRRRLPCLSSWWPTIT